MHNIFSWFLHEKHLGNLIRHGKSLAYKRFKPIVALWQVSNKTEAVKYKWCNRKRGSLAVIFSLCSLQPPSNVLFLNLVLWQTTITPKFWSKLVLCSCIVIIDIYIHKIYTNYIFYSPKAMRGKLHQDFQIFYVYFVM